MDLGPCPSCGLTPLGNGLLRHELDQLQRMRPEGAWVAEVCERCEGVCVIADPEEGWALGSPSPGPVHRISAALVTDATDVTERPVVRPSFAEEVAAPLPDPILVIERIVAEVTGEPVAAPAEDPVEEPAPAATPVPGGPTARTMLPESWAYAAK